MNRVAVFEQVDRHDQVGFTRIWSDIIVVLTMIILADTPNCQKHKDDPENKTPMTLHDSQVGESVIVIFELKQFAHKNCETCRFDFENWCCD